MPTLSGNTIPPQPCSPATLKALNQHYATLSPTNLLQWAYTTYGSSLVVATSFGLSGMVILHTVAQMQPRPPVFYLQTDLFFPETLTLRDELATRFALEFIEVHSGLSLAAQEQQYGPELWRRDPDLCCHLRKVRALRHFLEDKRAWVTGLRRDQSPTRAQTDLLAWDNTHHLLKLNPLALWTREQVWDYIHKHDMPYNLLHDQSYPSIGCWPCTKPTEMAVNERMGRWSDFGKTECGIHVDYIL
ncbi:MAG: phosphoadenylyl-sulfate reductase [Chloroflexi bacterium]|nr:phosphoadenylyl-sulfate reductase [Chloroflexota bacterium]